MTFDNFCKVTVVNLRLKTGSKNKRNVRSFTNQKMEIAKSIKEQKKCL